MVNPVFAGVLAVIVVVLPRLVVHVGAAVESVGAAVVVVVVVHHRAHHDSGGEPDHAGRHGLIRVVFLNHHGGRGGRLSVNNLRVVLRDVHDLRVGGLNHNHAVA